jgi:hypothetical protein
LAKQASIKTVAVITTIAWQMGAVDSAPYNTKAQKDF